MLNKGHTDALVKHLRDIAVILESSVATAASSSNPAFASSVATKSAKVANKSVAVAAAAPVDAKKRGRKPGAVADEERCENVNDKQLRCKNRATKGTVCGKHLPA
jgi:hypothetical protein